MVHVTSVAQEIDCRVAGLLANRNCDRL